jgi:hypothetical protein
MKSREQEKMMSIQPKVLLTPEDYLAGVKAPADRLIESLAEYLMITQDAYRVAQYIRQPDDRRLLTDICSLETSIELASIHCELAMSDIYDKVRARDGLFHKSPE